MQTFLNKILIISVEALGISDIQTRRYVVDYKKYPAHAFEERRWKVIFHDNDYYTVEGFSLYAFGSIVLLCPSEIKEAEEKRKKGERESMAKWNIDNLKSKTKNCISFTKDGIRKLDGT